MRQGTGLIFGASAAFLFAPASALASERGLADPIEAFTRGGGAMYPVLLLAALGLALALARLVALRHGRSVPGLWDARLHGTLESGGPRAAVVLCEKGTSALARVYRALLSRADASHRELALTVESECARLRFDLVRRARPVLATAVAAPLAGFAGLVWNVARVFDCVARLGTVPGGLQRGLAGALIAGAFGLAAAAVLTIFYHWVRGRGDAVAREVEDRALVFARELHAGGRASVSSIEADDIETQTMHPPVGERSGK